MNLVNKWSVVLYNPFLFIAGYKSLLIGISTLILTAYLSYITGTHYNGLMNVHFAKDTLFVFYFIEQVSHWVILSVLLFVLGTFLSKSKIRFIDVIGTQAMARVPLIILPAVRTLPPFQSFVINSFEMQFLITLYIMLVIWSVALMFNA